MKFKIDDEGYLKIQRGKFMCRVECPIDGSKTQCGSWCALFGEPETMLDHEAKPYISLELCKKTLITKAKDFEDER
jgi:hypothetical protein